MRTALVKRLWSVPPLPTHTYKGQSANYRSDGISKHLLNLNILLYYLEKWECTTEGLDYLEKLEPAHQ